jgi:DNA-binding response OmpR family regulator
MAEGNVVRREDLLAQVWGEAFAGEPQVLYVHINWLREKLETDPRKPERIQTVHGVGYKLCRVERDAADIT